MAQDHQYLAQLVRQAQSGSSDAFAELYVATCQRQYRFSYQYLKNEFLAQDAVQETYIQVLKNISTLRDPLLFSAWLNQINMRVCYAIYQKESADHRHLALYTQAAVPDRANSPELRFMEDFDREYLLGQVMALPFSESQAIFLRYFRNMKLEEIAKMMEISVSSVKRYIKSGQKTLSQQLKS